MASPTINKHASPPPACITSLNRYREKVEAFNARLDAQEAARRRKRRNKESDVDDDDVQQGEPGYGGDAIWIRKGMVPIVFLIMWWVYGVYVARLCVPAIQRSDQALTTRSTGIALLVVITLLMLMTLWTYLRVLSTPPGLVRDHVGVSDCPPEEADEYYARPPPGPEWTQQQAPYPQPYVPEPNQAGDDLPALVGPLATAIFANSADVGSTVTTQPFSNTPPTSPQATSVTPPPAATQFHPTPSGTQRVLIPEPVRLPPSKAVLAPGNRYCFRCQRVKPPRAHHCRRCGTCVLKMDHHCPWVGGCVGARNHKFFFHFVTWTTLYEVFALVSTAVLFSRGVRGASVYAAWRVDGFLISLFVLCAMFTLFTGALFTTHLYLLLHNMTTIEHMAFDRIKRNEEALLSAYFSNAGHGGPGLKLRQRRDVRRKWEQMWGRTKREGNLWWNDASEGKSAHRRNWETTMGNRWWQWIREYLVIH